MCTIMNNAKSMNKWILKKQKLAMVYSSFSISASATVQLLQTNGQGHILNQLKYRSSHVLQDITALGTRF